MHLKRALHRKKIKEKLQKKAGKLFHQQPATVILEDLEAEPEDLAELMLSLEQEFDLTWTDDDLRDLRTVGDLTSFVENQLA